jgi:hypothetical protein
MSDCDWTLERLPLLRYADELSTDERVRLLSHLERCAGCRALRAADEATAAALDAAPLRHPGADRLAGLKASVLAAVSPAAPCPREVELADTPDASHLAACASCRAAARDFEAVDRALELEPPLPRAALAAQRAALVAWFPEATPVGSRAVRRAPSPTRWSTVALRAAAAVLLLGGVFSATSQALRPDAPGSVELLALAKRGADGVLVGGTGDAIALRRAANGYAHVAAHVESHRARDQRALAIAHVARREAEALEALARADHRSAEGLEAVVADHPEAPAALECALDKLRGLRGSIGVGISPPDTPDAIQLNDAADPLAHIRPFVKSPRAQAALLFQRGVRLEEGGRLLEARGVYEQVVALGGDAPAVGLARARLARL